MAHIELLTEIAAPPEVCFDLSRDVDFHASVPALRHRAVAGVTAGRLEAGDSVTWQARQFGLVMTMTSQIVEMAQPARFVDQMTSGPFGRWRHTHTFNRVTGGTLMRDEVEFASPLGPLGQLVDRVYMRAHMEGFLRQQNTHLKRVAEAQAAARP